MIKHSPLNHEAMPQVARQVEAFRDEHNLTGEVNLEAVQRVDHAKQMLGEIVEASDGEPIDGVVAEFVNHSVVSDAAPEDVRSAVAVGIEEVYEHPLNSPHTAGELGEAPLADLGAAMRDLDEVKGERAVEAVIEAIEARDNVDSESPVQTRHEKNQDALWKRVAMSESYPVYVNGNARVSRIPLSLPLGNLNEYNTAAVQYATGEELEELLTAHNVDQEAITAAENSNWDVPVDALPEDLRRTMTAANMYEAMTRSKDQELKQQASERNGKVTLEDIWNNKTLHHVTRAKNLDSILTDGQLGYADINGDVINTGGTVHTGNVNFGVSTREIPANASNKEHMDALSYNNRGDIYIHYARPEGCYREGEEYSAGSDIMLMSGGMPSTEISALMVRNSNDTQALEQAWRAVDKAGFYIPIFDADGNKVFTKEDFDEGNVPGAVAQKLQAETRAREQMEAYAQTQQEKLATESASQGMSVEQYKEWKHSQPVSRPMM